MDIKYIREKYGHLASFALWKDKDGKEKSNVGDLSIFDSTTILKTNIVFVGLNISEKITRAFGNFHSLSPNANDYKIRYAVKDTIFEGAYMTDIIKNFENKISGDVMRYLKNNPDFLRQNIESFKQELIDIGNDDLKNITIIAFGNDCHQILISAGICSKIYKVSHYSSRQKSLKEKLRSEILNLQSLL